MRRSWRSKLQDVVAWGQKGRGVGAHLSAIACKLSWDAGNEGYVQFTAKTDLVSHYMEELGAKMIDWHTLFIDSYGAIALIKKYSRSAHLRASRSVKGYNDLVGVYITRVARVGDNRGRGTDNLRIRLRLRIYIQVILQILQHPRASHP